MAPIAWLLADKAWDDLTRLKHSHPECPTLYDRKVVRRMGFEPADKKVEEYRAAVTAP